MSLLKDSEIKVSVQFKGKDQVEMVLQELKEAYYTELSASKAATTATANFFKESKGKSKLLVKKKVAEDLFASDDETVSKGRKRKVQEVEVREVVITPQSRRRKSCN